MAQSGKLDSPPLDPTPSTKAKSETQDQFREDELLQGQAPSKLAGPRSENRKRPATDSSSDATPSKRPETIDHRSWNFPPEFYDNLSRTWLTPLALRELDRRNRQGPPPSPVVTQASIEDRLSAGITNLARFARMGGPDLCDLRGHPNPSTITVTMDSPSEPSTINRPLQSTKVTTVAVKRSTAYDANFRQYCKDNQIYPPFYEFPDGRRPKPANLDEILQALKAPRGSLSPSGASETAFEQFQIKNTTKSEGTVMRNIIPFVAGDSEILNEGHLPFVNLASITKNMTVNPNPDFFDGAHPDAVNAEVKQALDKIIAPTKKVNSPIAPNLFLEAKSSGGTLDVAESQVTLDGAYGATMIHSLQNYLLEEPVYDNNAYTFSAVFLGGYLSLYAHHLTAPIELGQSPSCHITQINAYALTGNSESWMEGVGAFRNLRKLAKQYRDQFIEVANARALKVAVLDEEPLATEPKQDEESGSDIVLGSLPLVNSCENEKDTQEIIAGLGILYEYIKDAEDEPLSQH